MCQTPNTCPVYGFIRRRRRDCPVYEFIRRRLDGNQWLLCIGFAIALTLVYEAMKVFLRRSKRQGRL